MIVRTSLWLIALVLLVVAISSYQASITGPFVSTELRFTDPSPSGLHIVPASCNASPPNPHYSGACDVPPKPFPPSWCPPNGAGSGNCECQITASSYNPVAPTTITLGWAAPTTYASSPAVTTNRQISPGIGSVPSSGSRSVAINGPTTFTYTGRIRSIWYGVGGTFSCSRTISATCATGYGLDPISNQCVEGLPPPPPPPSGSCEGEACEEVTPPPVVTFWADQYLIQRGDTTVLHWTAENVNTCQVLDSDWITEGDVTNESTTTDPILSQTTYTLRCEGDDESIVERERTIDIIPVFCETGAPGCNNPGGQSNAGQRSQVAAAAGATEADLSATIRAAVLSDPRSADMSEAEIDALVAALVQEAQGQDINSEDILWRPQEESTFASQDSVATCNFLCMLNQAFGLDGSDVAIPIGLGVTAAMLLFVIGSILHHRFGHHPVAGDLKVNAQ